MYTLDSFIMWLLYPIYSVHKARGRLAVGRIFKHLLWLKSAGDKWTFCIGFIFNLLLSL